MANVRTLRRSRFLVQSESELCGTIGPVGQEVAVKKKRFSVEQITSVLQQVEGGVPVGDVCRHVGRDDRRRLVPRI
jgi:hypothetical protein